MSPARAVSSASPGADPAGRRVASWLAGASLEVTARDASADAVCREHLAPGARVFINHAPEDATQDVVAAAVRLTRAGLTPVPHVAARALESFTRANDFLARAVGEAGVAEVLVVAGDLERPVGPYGASADLLATGLFEKHGIRGVGIAGYPERHPRIAPAALEAARAAKLARIRAGGLEPFVLTQFCLEAAPIVAWLAAARAAGVDCPIRVGLAGPCPVATLATYAVRCGIGGSIRALARGQTSVARHTREAGPEPIIRALAHAAAPLDGLHIYCFGGLARTASWLAAAARGDFTL